MIVLGRKKQSEKFILESVKPGLVLLSCLDLPDSFAIPWTTARQCPLSMKFPRQEYWVGCHFLLKRIFPSQ